MPSTRAGFSHLVTYRPLVVDAHAGTVIRASFTVHRREWPDPCYLCWRFQCIRWSRHA